MQISQNAVVTFHYALINDQGEVIDGTKGGDPIPYLHGHKNIVPGLELALEGKALGDHFKISLKANEAYGAYDEDKVFDVERSLFSVIPDLAEGYMCHLTNEQGQDELVTVIEINDELVTVDANHPYAGQDLTFDVEVVSVRPATEQELAAGHAAV